MRKLSAITLFLSVFLNLARAQTKVIHVFVALCDNKYQGIVPVPAKIGNGQDPKNNLYWGCGYGVKMFFINHSKDWKLLKSLPNPKTNVLERCVYKHKTKDCYLVADAYDGQYIKQTTIDFLNACAGIFKDSIAVEENRYVGTGGKSDLVAYVGHDGLMDFQLDKLPAKANDKKRDAMIYACASKSFFKEAMQKNGAYPLVWTTGLCSPEAYSLSFAVDSWLKNQSPQEVRKAAATGYSTYQKTCSLKSALGLMSTGF
jgi:hypothetical protein